MLSFYRGDSSDDVIVKCLDINGFATVFDSGWVAHMMVVQYLGGNPLISKDLLPSPDSTYFINNITRQESASLLEGPYIMVITLDHPEEDFHRTKYEAVNVEEPLLA